MVEVDVAFIVVVVEVEVLRGIEEDVVVEEEAAANVVADVVADMISNNEKVPTPLSGKI